MKYTFYDIDYYKNNGEYDISGSDYKLLIDKCCEYCEYFSLLFYEDSVITNEALYKYEVVNTNIQSHSPEYRRIENDSDQSIRMIAPEFKVFKACHETREILISNYNSVFDFINGWEQKNPEDLSFYRNDGTVFFSSVVHDGKCMLYPRENENITDILCFSNNHWIAEQE